MTRVLMPGGFVPRPDDGLGPFGPPLAAARIVLMAFHGGPEAPSFAPVRPAGAAEAVGARLVRGEILRDPPGRLYELCGRELRPLYRVVQGPRGEILEVQPPAPQMASGPPVVDAEIVEADRPRVGPGPSASPAYRKLFPDAGAKCVVSLGDFRSLLAPQIARPQQLRDSHRLACHVQVYESTMAQPYESLVAAIVADAGPSAEIRPLSEPAAARLGLPGLRRRPGAGPRGQRRSGEVLALDRVFCLRLVSDPTAVAADWAPAAPAPAPSAAAPAGPSRARSTSIPERFLAPWEFPLAREEALCEMEAESMSGWLPRALRRLWNRVARRGEIAKWRARCSGKPPDEQLWRVRPPKGLLGHGGVRERARDTLEAAGYDAGAMIREWEIYWRRKGI